MKGAAPRYSMFRIFLVIGVFLAFFGAVLFRAFELQVLKGRDLKALAERQYSKTLNVQSKRGDIYDRNMKELAVSIEVDSVYSQPAGVRSRRAVARALAPILSMERSEIEKRLASRSGFVWLKRQVDLRDDSRKAVSDLDGVGLVKESRRFYPNLQLASNIIGFTGVDSNGLEGVELFYDDVLKGESSEVTGEKDARGGVLLYEDPDKTVPVEGSVVELTIDKTIQYIAEKSLRKAVDASGAKGGTALVMDPATGEVLAMASLPTFDPNDFRKYPPERRRNRAVTDVFEPGSTLKLFIISAALEEGVIGPRTVVFCENGLYRVSDRVFHDTKPYGWLSTAQVLKHSSNIGAAKIGERLGRARLYRYLKSFGFGAGTGVDLPGEVAGSLRHYGDWSDVTLQTVSFGQGVSTTSIQLATALSAIANGGFLMRPYMARSVKDAGGAVLKETAPVIVRRVISEETAGAVAEMLTGVVGKGGTGSLAAVEGFEVAGKTGTAQKPDLDHGGYADGAFVASFMGFVPAKDPRLTILVTVDEPQGDYHGGTVAAPVFREIASRSLAYMGVFPEETAAPVVAAGAVAEDVPLTAVGAVPFGVPDFTGRTVRTALRMAKEGAFEVEVHGSGKAVSQRPEAGSGVPRNGRVSVWFR
jgi:cell division protein FtsI (penicillin-binding protein 3)